MEAARAQAAKAETTDPDDKPKRQTKAEVSAEMVNGLLDAFDVFAGVVVGTQLTGDERALIQPSLERISGRMSSRAVKRAQGLVDPLCVIGGFALFGMRALALNQPTRPLGVVPERREPAPEPAREGAERSAYEPPKEINEILQGGL